MRHCFGVRQYAVYLCDGHTLEQHFLCLQTSSRIFSKMVC